MDYWLLVEYWVLQMEIKMSSKLLDIDKSTDDKYSLFIYLMSYYLCTITQMVYKQQLTSNYSLL